MIFLGPEQVRVEYTDADLSPISKEGGLSARVPLVSSNLSGSPSAFSSSE